MQIGRVAQSTGLSVDTIRFYEKQSLIPLAQRTDAGYRVYDESTVDRLQLIGRAQSLGFSLQEIRELLLIEDGQPDGCSHVRDLIADRVKQVKEKIAGLRRIEKRLAKAQEQCGTALKRSCSAQCPVLQELESRRERGSK
jgi:DNA-binding transcriptional MerR regulator